MTAGSGRVTQAQVARLAGVSQAVVSMVLNGSESLRITDETRERVQEVLRSTGYTVDIMGRRLRGKSNHILGVFSYESVFPSRVADFYRPFLLGIEEEAEAQGFDLLLFTSGGRRDGRRRIYDQGTNRLGIADGSVLLGRHNDPQELARLAEDRFPFVFVGRRESPAGPISYVGADYVAATRQVHEWLWGLGHRRIGLLSVTEDSEPTLDRRAGYEAAVRHRRRKPLVFLEDDPVAALREALGQDVTALLVESTAMADAVLAAAHAAGVGVPGGLSLVVLGDADPSQQPAAHAVPSTATDWSMFRIPRHEMGVHAVRALVGLLESPRPRQLLLPCAVHEGATVAPPPAVRHR
ncbi:LacI family transcriptional regulator [Amycolatopsis acidiphila]|uniref:LacI family transcriptional regulator n=1 Tax=Amycolatopsis acidiphila TaxID=715473 RepID=A0A558A3D5_9PSEU|nr:LacI family DNA-binding transcriptional regulator [Amycolatopsis acidiphila]TVT18783.1 LacI family transcriptional regulator [Amycolatopsis acidiphila]UIJ56975.1 LacI family transcriptional regulator [Amycolatopsis acidiphila]GHG54021.1 LacI family transcriptional regulator [Amycolatopsis acidiphila]